MKKLFILLMSLCLVAGLFAGCASSTPPQGGSESDASAQDGGESDAPTQDSGAPSVILLVPGSLGDKSFFDSANEGIKAIESSYGCKTKVIEMGTDVAKFVPTFEDVIAEGWDIIVTGGINVAQPMQEIAAKYPDQKFILYDETVEFDGGKNANVYCMTYKAYEGAYLAGVLAAGYTDGKAIGFAGGFDIPLINDFLMGYIQGAQSVQPDIKVGIGYIGSFTDAARGKEIGVALYNSGVGVVFQAAGGAGLGVLDAAKEMQARAIGTDSDQSALFASDEAKADAILASVLKRVDRSIEMAVGQHMDGSLPYGSFQSYGIAEGCIEITDNQWYQANVPEAVRDAVTEAYNKLASGETAVKSAFEMEDEEIATIKGEVQM